MDPELEQIHQLLKAEADKIKETLGLDSVVIIVTTSQTERTQRVSAAAGNLYANIGAMMETLDVYTASDE
jgi:hypothetical protein